MIAPTKTETEKKENFGVVKQTKESQLHTQHYRIDTQRSIRLMKLCHTGARHLLATINCNRYSLRVPPQPTTAWQTRDVF